MDDNQQKRVFLSESKGKIKIEVHRASEVTIVSWESTKGGILETFFNNDGAILKQRISSTANLGDELRNFLLGLNSEDVRNKDYEEIKLKRPCPKCNAKSHKRIMENKDGGIPIMPLYTCENCGEKGFYITNEYLKFLVENNSSLFEDKELSKLKENKEEFLFELNEYVSRIFSAKHINHIK